MNRSTTALLLSQIIAVAAQATHLAPITPTVLVFHLPSEPDPPEHDRNAGALYHGTWRWVDTKGLPAPVDPMRALSEAALRCGQQHFDLRNLNSDHRSEMVLANGPVAKQVLRCIARKVSFDFYVRVERTRLNTR